MKTIAIIGAMEEEIAAIKQKMEVITTKNVIGIDFYLGKMNGKSIVLVKSGVGKVNAAICTQILIDLFGADYCINVGVAGAVSNELEIGDVVISDDVVTHDFDATALGKYEIGIIPDMEKSFFPADRELIEMAQKIGAEFIQSNVVVGRIASGDQFIGNHEDKQTIWNRFKAMCVEMESVAVAQTCYLNKIPFVIIRSISDKADPEAISNYPKFLNFAAANSSIIVENLVNEIL